MGYLLNAFIGPINSLTTIQAKYQTARIVRLTAELGLIPMTEDLFEEMNKLNSDNTQVNNFELLTDHMESEMLALMKNDILAYVEAEYFGGQGGQSGILWKDQKRIYEQGFQQGVVNTILHHLGVVKENSLDEFDTVGLDRHRETSEWK